ncbi:MAG TPA: RNA-binding protein [Terrimicrobiaceae bacterium]
MAPNKKTYRNIMKLYVGNLSFQTTEGALEELFTQFGTVTEAMLVMDKMTQRPRGFGFVTMGSNDEAQKAIEALNGKNVDGRNLIVNEARPREERPPRRDFGGGGGGGQRRPQHGKGGGGGYRDRR